MISGKILRYHGWPEGKALGAAKKIAEQLMQSGMDKDAALHLLDEVLAQPAQFANDFRVSDLAELLLPEVEAVIQKIDLRGDPVEYRTWGAENIEAETINQMSQAMRLPVAIAGALMPDAHVGYGLPIGGVLATENEVIPYAVGVDIACRMRLSLYAEPTEILTASRQRFEKALFSQTRFGLNAHWDKQDEPEHKVLDDPDWNATPLLRSLLDKAQRQLGTSGSGNHFVEWGKVRLFADNALPGLKAGVYLALLSHSGSRGVGARIAETYTTAATQSLQGLPESLRHLAWLSLESGTGSEYWLSMQLAGKFAQANHEIIHKRVAAAAGIDAIASVENHHNFAWKEALAGGSNAIVHRKGATPANMGELGIIPGSMGAAGYIVRGKGNKDALNSASHGAGRAMSRKTALKTITKTMRDTYLREHGVVLLGGGLDESPQAYKDIESVIRSQDELVEVIGKFTPIIVRMAEEQGQY